MLKRLALKLLIGLALITFSLSIVLVTQAERGDDWDADFYDCSDLDCDREESVNYDDGINFDWGNGRPEDDDGDPIDGIGNDDFSVRFETTEFFDVGEYEFIVTANDGVRLFIDGNLILNEWNDRDDEDTFEVRWTNSTAGDKSLRVEYYDDNDEAVIQVEWFRVGDAFTATPEGPTPTPGPTLTPSNTPLPFIPPGALTATVINAAILNARDAPTLQGSNVIGKLLRGQTYQVVGRDDRARWFVLQLSDRRAWVWGHYLYIDGNEFNAPVTTATGLTGLPGGVADTGVVVVTRAGMKLRAAPNTDSEQIGRVSWGAYLPVVGKTGDGLWFQVVWKGTVGWLWTGYLEKREGDLVNVPVTG